MSLNIENISIKLDNYYQIKLTCTALGVDLEYAYYVYKDGQVIEKFPYSKESSFLYNLIEQGTYRIRVFIRDGAGNKDAKTSKEIIFSSFADSNVDKSHPQIIIHGVSKTSVFIKAILEKYYHVLCFCDEDPNKFGDHFFGLEVKSIEEIKQIKNSKIVVTCDPTEAILDALTGRNEKNYEFFSFSFSPENSVIKVMYEMKSIDLYMVSKFCYRNGLIKEANFIRDFIQFKFNSYIPYTAEIGEGTRFGYGGVGLVIHKKAKIGKGCVISQNVTIGSRGPLPEIGDNVFIAPGAKCIGGKIGNNVIIGANAVVTKDIPDNCVVAGVPAKVISTNINNYDRYFN